MSRALELKWFGLLPILLVVLALGVYLPWFGLAAIVGLPLAAILVVRWRSEPLKLPRLSLPALIGFGLPFQLFSLWLNFSWLDLLIGLLFLHLLIQNLRAGRKEAVGRLTLALRQPVVWAYSLFILVNVAGLGLSLDIYKGLASVAQFGLLLVWLVTLLTLLSSREKVRHFLLGAVFGAGLCAVVGVIQHYNPALVLLPGVSAERILTFQERSPSLLGDPNYFAAYLVTFAPITLALLMTEKSRQLRRLLTLNLLVMLPGFYFSYSRGGLIALVVMLVLSGFLLPRSFWSKSLVLAGLVMLALLLYAGLNLAGDRTFDEFTGRYATILDENQFNRVARLGYTATALNMFMDSPVLGRGPGQFPANFLRYRTTESIANWLTPVTHNSYAEALATSGLLGAVCLAAVLLFTFVSLWRSSRKLGLVEAVWARGILAGLLGLLVAALLLDLFTQRYFFALIALAPVLNLLIRREKLLGAIE